MGEQASSAIRTALEVGKRKAFATALDWPGWSRSGKDGASAVEALLAYRERYAEVVRIAGLEPHREDSLATSVVEEVPGDSTTEFGVPARIIEADREVLDEDEAKRHLTLLRAAWTSFDNVAATVTPELKKGPRGGGRNRDALVEHVLEAERAYARKIGVRTARLAIGEASAIEAHRRAILDALTELARTGDIPAKGWPSRYAIRRMAWHVLDHAWEMQDKTLG